MAPRVLCGMFGVACAHSHVACFGVWYVWSCCMACLQPHVRVYGVARADACIEAQTTLEHAHASSAVRDASQMTVKRDV